MRIINLLLRARFKTQTVGVPGRVLAHSTMKFPKLWMAGNNVGVAQAPGATIHFRNPNDALGNEDTASRAPKAPTPLMGESLDIIGSLNHLHLDPLGGGNVWSCTPQHIFHRIVEALGPIQGPLFDLPLTRSRGGPGSPSTGTTCVSSQECLISSIEDPSLLSWPWGVLVDAMVCAAASAPSQLDPSCRESPPTWSPAWAVVVLPPRSGCCLDGKQRSCDEAICRHASKQLAPRII